MSEAMKEIRFTFNFLREMVIKVMLPIMERTDNFGAMLMAENANSGNRTRHIDTRCHSIREHVEDSFTKFVLVKTDNDDSEFFTKNFNKDTY
jgi:hypothetical protein